MSSKIKYYIYLSFGSLSLSLSIMGLFLPVLPTTPFLLLSSYCFIRSSKKMNFWLTNHKIFGTYIRNYIEYKAIKKSDRIKALAFLWITLIITMNVSSHLNLTYFLIVIGIAVSIHLFKLNTLD